MLAVKQLTKQVFKNRIFILLIMILITLGSLSFFFVRFSIDGNQKQIDTIMANGGDIAKYKTGTESNRMLAYAFLLATCILISFVFFMFYYRLFRIECRQFGCLKALGFQDKFLQSYFVVFTAIFALIGGLIGLVIAYPLSNILIQANIDTYNVTGLIKSINISTVLIYLIITMIVFSAIAFFSYFFIKGKEAGALISGNKNEVSDSLSLRVADKISALLPIKNKFPIRLVFRKPMTVFLVFIAVMSFATCMILAYSLNGSSKKVFVSQTDGHNYEYMISYDQYISKDNNDNLIFKMLETEVNIVIQKQEIMYVMSGLYESNALYELKDNNNDTLFVPNKGNIIIDSELQKVYGVKIGDPLSIEINNQSIELNVINIAKNAQAHTLYMNGTELASLLDIHQGSYNLLLTNELPSYGESVSRAQRMEALERDAVSNRTSGVINQVIGAVIGCILLFLALYMSFQNNIRDMLIMHMMGYRPKTIRKIFIDIYRPLVLAFFALALLPSILLVQNIQKKLSITTGDYMPFVTNIGIILFILLILLLIYQLVQCLCNIMLKRVI